MHKETFTIKNLEIELILLNENKMIAPSDPIKINFISQINSKTANTHAVVNRKLNFKSKFIILSGNGLFVRKKLSRPDNKLLEINILGDKNFKGSFLLSKLKKYAPTVFDLKAVDHINAKLVLNQNIEHVKSSLSKILDPEEYAEFLEDIAIFQNADSSVESILDEMILKFD